jgi:hypothetical protein
MPELNVENQAKLSLVSGDMMTLLLLDDAWTELVQQRSTASDRPTAPLPVGHPDSLVRITDQMEDLLVRIGEAARFIGSLPDRMGDDLSDRFDALMWGDWLSTAGRDDLRWLVTRAGGAARLAYLAEEALSDYQAEVDDLRRQVGRGPRNQMRATIEEAQPEGDLSKSYRCGLGTGLLVSGAAALPSAIGTGAAAAVTAGAGALAAGVIVGVSGGVGAIAIIIAGLLVMRRAKC